MSDDVTALRILGEGPDERAIVGALLHPRTSKARNDNYRPSYQGYPHLRKRLPDELGSTSAARFLIVIDADDEPMERWKSITDRLAECGYAEAPKQPEPCILNPPNKKPVGLWMMPDNGSSGEIETFYEKIIVPGDAGWSHAGHVVDKLPDDVRQFERKLRLPLKAQINTWLAWQRDPGLRSGTAILNLSERFQLNHPLVQALQKLSDDLLAIPA
jgi:hypothetical protein